MDIFEVTDSLTPGNVKWMHYSPIGSDRLTGLESASSFSCTKSWLYTGGCHFDSIKPLDNEGLTRPHIDVNQYEVDLTREIHI